MKKLNRKGFTLIELLAVIVVLAIVLVVTIPSVLRSVDSAREKSLENAANSVADWMTRQDELKAMKGTGVIDDSNLDTNFSALTIPDGYSNATNLGANADAILKAAGIGGGTSDVTAKVWRGNNRICVELKAVNGDASKSRFKGVNDAKVSAGCTTS